MKEYALILAVRASEILGQALGRSPEAIGAVVDLPGPRSIDHTPPLAERAAAIEFEASGATPLRGLIMCGRAGQKTLRALAASCGLAEADDCREEADLLGEFLNIVIGLTAADWAAKGLDIRFNPPLKSGFKAPELLAGRFCRITLGAEADEGLTIDLLFSGPA